MSNITTSTLIRDLSGITLTQNLTGSYDYPLAIDTNNGPAGAQRTQKITLKDIRNFVLMSSTVFETPGLTLNNNKSLCIANGTESDGVKVGVGTNSPLYKLDVRGNVGISQTLTAGSFIYGPAGRDCFKGNADTASALYEGQTLFVGGQLSGQTTPKEFTGDKSATINATLIPNTVKQDQLESFSIGGSGAGVHTLPTITLTDKGTVTSVDRGLLYGAVYSISTDDNLKTALSAQVVMNDNVNDSAAIADTKLDTIKTAGKILNSATTATANKTNSAIVARDGIGDFHANHVIADLIGNATTATSWQTARTLSFDGDVTMQGTLDGTADVSFTTAIRDNKIKTKHIDAFQITTGLLASDSVTNTKIATDQVDGGHLKDGIISPAKLATNAVTTVKMEDDCVTDDKLSNHPADDSLRAVGNLHIKTDAVRTEHVKDDNITSAKLDQESPYLAGQPSHIVGSTSKIPVLTFNDKGRITNYSTADVVDYFSGAAATNHLTGTYPGPSIANNVVTNDHIYSAAGIVDTKLATIATAGKVSNSATTATDNYTGSTIMLRDSSGNTKINKLTAYDDVIVAASSDITLKNNVNRLTGCLTKLGKIRGVEYDWNDKQDSYKGHDIGVIAQEVEEIFPEAVVTRESGIKAVRYERLIPVLIEAIKELQEQVNSLKNK